MQFKLKPFQETTVDFGVANGYAIYGLQMGLGKSACGIETANRTKSKTLIICPAYLRLKWVEEIKKFSPNSTVSVFEKETQLYFPWDSDFSIISYHLIPKSDVLFEWADMVIVDEAHMLKEIKAKRTEAFHKLVFENSIKRCLLLTGTPIQNRVYEIWSLLAICYYNPKYTTTPDFLIKYPNYVDFANHFSELVEFDVWNAKKQKMVRVQRWEGIKNVDELKTYLKDTYIRFDSDVLGLPDYQELDVPVIYEDDPNLQEVFDRFTDRADPEEIIKGLDAKIKIQAAMAKAPFTVEYVRGLLEEVDQVVIYTDHVEPCEFIANKLGVTPITGDTPMKIRQKLAQDFMLKKDKVIVATIGSFSTGIDLYVANNMVFNDMNFVPGNMKQAMYRIRRIGQTKRCIFHFILGSIQDTKISNILRDKIKVIEEAL